MFSYDIETWRKMASKMIKNHWKEASYWRKCAFQVVIYTDNNENDIERCLESVEQAMSNFSKDTKWIFQIADGDSEDKTLEKIAKHAEKTSADKIHLYDFNKEEKRAVNENKLIKELHKYGEEYPAILFVEAGGIMYPERPLMFWTAASYNSPYVVGAWFDNETQEVLTSEDASYKLHFGPWATILHISLLPEDGKFFYESLNKGRDVLAWSQLRHINNINPVAHVRPEEPVHVYFRSDEPTIGLTAKFVGAEEGCEFEPPECESLDTISNRLEINSEESNLFLKMKSLLELKHDILKDVEPESISSTTVSL